MEKIKKIVMIVVLAILIAPALVSAKKNETYFKTESGYGITEEQYNNLIKVFSRDTVYTMDKSVVDLYKDNKNYTVNANGLGGVLDFAVSARGYYDGMQGVNITKRVG